MDKLANCVYKNITKFNKSKYKVLPIGQGNPRCEYKLGELIEISPEEKDLLVLIDKKLNISQQGVLTAQRANCILGCTVRGVAS